MAPDFPVHRSRLKQVVSFLGVAGLLLILLSALLQAGARAPGEGAQALLVLGILALIVAGGYYTFLALRWLASRLLWRVRRRLLVTFLFIGVTPIVLLAALGALGGFIASAEAMSRMVSAQIKAMDHRAISAARALARDYEALPEEPGPRSLESWLSSRRVLIQGSLPGVRLALWRGEGGGSGTIPAGSTPTPFASGPDQPDDAPLGPTEAPAGGPLPSWLLELDQWHGVAFVPPAPGSGTLFGSMSIRGLARGEARGRPFACLVDVPLSRSLVRHLREMTDLRVHPYFLASPETAVMVTSGSVGLGDPDARRKRRAAAPAGGEPPMEPEDMPRVDQAGEPLPPLPYWVVLAATDWTSGESSQRIAFVLMWSWAEATRHILGGSPAGRVLRYALIGTGLVFLGLEIVALLSALWMTRAVTRTVDDLHRATEFIDQGVFSHRVRPHSRDQLGDLARAYNHMSARIESLLEERVKAERLEREVEIAAEVQNQLFPREVPRLRTARIAGACRAARGVAGDYYDYLQVAPDLVLLALGDVSGKGISASLVMSNLQAAIRAHTGVIIERSRVPAPMPSPEPAAVRLAPGDKHANLPRITAIVNDQLWRSTDDNRFATLFLALYDDRTGRLRYVNAGHNAAILVGPDGEVSRLVRGGTVVGAFEDAAYEEGAAEFAPGSLLVIFSDGISETANPSDEFYGEERLAHLCADSRHLDAEAVLRTVFEEIDGWSAGREREDDQTLVVLKAGRGGA